MSASSSRNSRGFSLLEMMLAIIAGAGFVAFAISTFGSRTGDAKAYAYVQTAQQLQRVIEAGWPGGDYTGISSAAVLPMISANQGLAAGGSLRSPNGQAITVVAVSPAGRLASSSYEMRFPGMARSECVQFVAAMTPGMDYVRAGSKVLIDRSTGVVQYTQTQLNTACAAASTLVYLRPAR